MYLQGQWTKIFEALYQLGWVHRMLQTSWRPVLQTPLSPLQHKELMQKITPNSCNLKNQLQSLSPLQLQHLTVCVAQELANVNKKRVLH